MRKIYILLLLCSMTVGKMFSQTTLLSESFESATFPPTGWKNINNGTGSIWSRNTTATYSVSGTASLRCVRNATNANDAWMFTPKLALNTNACNITFWVRIRAAADTGKLKFTIGSDTTVASQTITLADSSNITNTTYTQWSINYSPTVAGNYNFAFNCYSNARTVASQSVYIDSVVITQLQNNCTGTPTGGTISSTSILVCPSTSYTLSVAGATNGVTGISYQWQSSLDSTNWTDISGDTTASITKSGLTTNTFYRRKTICAGSGLFDYSTAIKVAVNAIINCYCGPNTGVNLNTGNTGVSIDTVKIIGTNLNHTSTGIATGGYTLNSDSSLVPTATLQQSLQYSLFVGLTTVPGPPAVNGIASVWVDWNHNGTFDSTEYTRVVTNGQSGTITLTVPANAVLGATMMRIRTKNNTGGGLGIANACNSYTNGETEDYVIYVIQAIGCVGTPTGGTTLSNNNPVCANTQFILSVNGATSGLGGLTYQWQSSADNINWADITGATETTDTIKTGISSLTYFRRKIICNGGNFSYSSVDTLKLNLPINCYCSPTNGTILNTGTTGASIDTVNIIGTTWAGNISSGIAPYTLYKDSSILPFPKLQQAQTYSLFVGLTLAPGNGIASAWFDWNQNGKFDSSEYVRVVTNGQRGTVNFTVPLNAVLGNTVMRIRSKNNTGGGLGISTACTSYTNGETEDYTINVLAGNSCNGTPNPGTAYASVKAICPNTTFNLFDTASTSGVTGLTYQWQSSLDSTNWTDITGATSGNHPATIITSKTYFRRVTFCGTNAANSNAFSVNVYPASICIYCSPLSGTTLHTAATAPSIDSVIIIGTTLASASTGENAIAYTLDTTKPVPALYQTFNYTLRSRLSANGLAGAWVDWDHNGTFDSTEYAAITLTGTTGLATLTVPANASLGRTLLRVRSRSAGGGASITKTMGCTTFPQGETEDYIINLLTVPACLPPSGLTVSNITSSSGFVKWVAPSNIPSNGYDIYYNTTNNFSTATLGANGITIDSAQVNGLASSTFYYIWVVSNCGSSVSPATVFTTLTTACGVVTTLPLIQGFEGLTTVGAGIVPTCWTATTGVGRTNFTSSQTTSRNGIGARTGTKFIYTRRNNYDWLISPAVQLTAGTPYYLVYYYRPTDPNNGITINSFAAASNDTTTLATGAIGTSIVNPVDSSKYTQSVNSFTPTTSGVYYFAIQCINLAGAGAANNDMNIDDIFITNTLFTLPPSITSISPTKASLGNTVTIKGSNFTSATAVKFGATASSGFSVVSDSVINATVGNGSSGYVKVTNVIGADSIGGFTYCPPATTNNTSLNSCKSVTYLGTVYTSSSTIKDTLKNIAGCDSVYNNVNITITPITATTNNINFNSCNSVTYLGTVYTNSTTIKDTLKSLGGCDSIYNTANITINYRISGNIIHPTKGAISKVAFTAKNGNVADSAIVNGGYIDSCIAPQSNITIRVSKNNNVTKANGINTTDVLLVQRHILNTTKIINPYKLIAADVNGDGKINSTDILRIKRLVLGSDTTFTKGSGASKIDRLWEFVDSAYKFPDTTNPFPFKDSISFTNLTSNKINQTFIGVKLGDVDYNWSPGTARATATKPVDFVYTTKNQESGIWNSIIRIPVTVNNFKELVAMQYTMHFNNKDYEFVAIENNKIGIDFNDKQAMQTGDISFLWTDKNANEKTLNNGTELFVLVLQQKGIGNLELAINDAITDVSAWDKDFNQHDIILTKREILNEQLVIRNELFSVSPNPTTGIIKVDLIAKANKTIRFELSSLVGKTITQQTADLQKGNNTITINLKKNGTLATGIYFLKAVGLEGDNVKRIVVQ